MTNATLFSRLKSLLLLVLLLKVNLLSASPTPLALPSLDDVSLSKREDIPSYQTCVNRGERLQMLMPLDNIAAERQNGGRSVASQYQNPKVAARWGWTLKFWWYPFKNEISPMVAEEAYKDREFPIDWKQSGVYEYEHSKGFRQGQLKGMPTTAKCRNIINPSAGALIFGSNMSPNDLVEKHGGTGSVPELHMVSELAFFQWLEGCRYKKTSPKNLKVIFRTHITDLATFVIVMDALRDQGLKRVPGWKDRAKIPMSSRAGQAIIGSDVGAETAQMLIQHKDLLGRKEIVEAVVWGNPNGFELSASHDSVDLNIRFTIRDRDR
ncbi:hypothetical protein LX32DRAFT_626727 [Colletotrichum zoysiae]|uniref:Uncharacterized protein n=1 Tax=Colletotrichum zoysiae TaxID=1216348 RepID=A0AAD9LWY6_9PEZI|nr:hypothetical protein LX32DRAFT_626727 [Colletotrichum zoysiae]